MSPFHRVPVLKVDWSKVLFEKWFRKPNRYSLGCILPHFSQTQQVGTARTARPGEGHAWKTAISPGDNDPINHQLATTRSMTFWPVYSTWNCLPLPSCRPLTVAKVPVSEPAETIV
jgi:hypothetical protein